MFMLLPSFHEFCWSVICKERGGTFCFFTRLGANQRILRGKLPCFKVFALNIMFKHFNYYWKGSICDATTITHTHRIFLDQLVVSIYLTIILTNLQTRDKVLNLSPGLNLVIILGTLILFTTPYWKTKKTEEGVFIFCNSMVVIILFLFPWCILCQWIGKGYSLKCMFFWSNGWCLGRLWDVSNTYTKD